MAFIRRANSSSGIYRGMFKGILGRFHRRAISDVSFQLLDKAVISAYTEDRINDQLPTIRRRIAEQTVITFLVQEEGACPRSLMNRCAKRRGVALCARRPASLPAW